MASGNADLASIVDASAFKIAMRDVVGAASIVAAGKGSDRRGLTVTAAASLCADPPMVLVCINRNAEAHDIIVETRAFSWNVLASDQVTLAQRFAALDGSKGASRFIDGDWRALATGSPVLFSAVCSFDCAVQARVEVGTHSIFTGAVVAQHHASEKECLIFSSGKFGQIIYNK